MSRKVKFLYTEAVISWEGVMRTLYILFIFMPCFASAGRVIVNGKTWTCDGAISIIDGIVKCNGKPMKDSGGTSGPCSGSTTRRHPNGGGQVDVRANAHHSASIKGIVCGRANIAASAIIQRGSTINGAVEVGDGSVIGRNTTVNGSGKIGPKATIGRNVTLNGNVHIANTQVDNDTTLNGDIVIEGVSISGGITCSGDGKILANPSNATQ